MRRGEPEQAMCERGDGGERRRGRSCRLPLPVRVLLVRRVGRRRAVRGLAVLRRWLVAVRRRAVAVRLRGASVRRRGKRRGRRRRRRRERRGRGGARACGRETAEGREVGTACRARLFGGRGLLVSGTRGLGRRRLSGRESGRRDRRVLGTGEVVVHLAELLRLDRLVRPEEARPFPCETIPRSARQVTKKKKEGRATHRGACASSPWRTTTSQSRRRPRCERRSLSACP